LNAALEEKKKAVNALKYAYPSVMKWYTPGGDEDDEE
jgi:hypothetical protein